MDARSEKLPAKIDPDEHVNLELILTAAKSDPVAVIVGWNDEKVVTHRIRASARELLRSIIDEVDEHNSKHSDARWRTLAPTDGVE